LPDADFFSYAAARAQRRYFYFADAAIAGFFFFSPRRLSACRYFAIDTLIVDTYCCSFDMSADAASAFAPWLPPLRHAAASLPLSLFRLSCYFAAAIVAFAIIFTIIDAADAYAFARLMLSLLSSSMLTLLRRRRH
jgi:hypothetical protein